MDFLHYIGLLLLLCALREGLANSAYWILSPQNSTVVEEDSLTLFCKVGNGNGISPRWYRDGTQITDSYGSIDHAIYEISGEERGEHNIIIKSASKIDTATFKCSHVLASPQYQIAYVQVITPFASVEITRQSSNEYACHARKGNPAATSMVWKVNDIEMSSVLPLSNETDDEQYSSYSIYKVKQSVYDADFKLTCVVVQSDQVKNMTASITVNASCAVSNKSEYTMVAVTVIAMKMFGLF